MHRLAYLAAIAGALHFYMLVKADTTRPLIFASVLGLLLAYRLIAHYLQLRSDSLRYRAAPPPGAGPAKSKPWRGALRVARIFEETPEVRTFRLVAPTGSRLPFDFLPGQFLNLTLEIDGRKVRRCYTIASAPTRSGYCELTVKREERGLASRFLHDVVREGDALNVQAPAGRFTFTGAESERLVLIAGGVGITPLMSKIRYLTDLGWPGTMDLVVSAKTERDLIFRRELEELQSRFPNLKVSITLTRESSPAWHGERGRITADMLRRLVREISGSRCHLCGPTEMTAPVIDMLGDLGVAREQIQVESFASPSRTQRGDAPTAQADSAPVAMNSSAEVSIATLQFARSAKTVANLEGKTILEVAEEQDVRIAYDCRAGICGQCKTRLLAGAVTMDAEDALDPLDRANGVILSCQARCQDECIVDA